MSGHTLLAPSAAERWISCPGSIAAAKTAPPERPSIYAAEGTRAHEVYAQCLLAGSSVNSVLGDCTMTLPLQSAVDHTRRIIGGRPVLIEQRLPPLPGLEIWGTADVSVFDPANHLLQDIVDLKYGAGVAVEAHSIQLAIYAVLAAYSFGVSPIGVTAWVVQPRCPHPAGPVRHYHYTRSDLVRLVEELGPAARATTHPAAALNPGPWCRFCHAREGCDALRANPAALPSIASAGPPALPWDTDPW